MKVEGSRGIAEGIGFGEQCVLRSDKHDAQSECADAGVAARNGHAESRRQILGSPGIEGQCDLAAPI